RHLTLVAPRTDHEVVGDPDERTDVEDDDVAGQLRRGRPCGRQRLLHRITHRFRLSIPPFPVLLMLPRFLSGALRGASGVSLSSEVGSEYHRLVNHAGLWGTRAVPPRHRDGPRTHGFRRLPPDPPRGRRP